MRLGGFISLGLHVGFALAGLIAAPYLAREETSSMMILPVDLEIADSTNVIPEAQNVSEEDKSAEAPEPETFSSATPPPPPEEAEEILPDEKPKPKEEPKPPEPKKAEAAPAPPKKENSLTSILQGVDRSEANPRGTPAPSSSLRDVANAGAQKGTGDMKRMSMTIADAIMSQLIARNCWGSQQDMADARRLGAVIAIQFNRGGNVSKMELIEPRSKPTNDMPLQVFIQRAYDAIRKCDTPKFQVPKEYYEYNPPLVIELNFRP